MGQKKKNILGFIKLKTFMLQKTPSRKWKQQSEGEKIFANHISDKGLVSRLYKKPPITQW